jgi:hypothetical protein
MTDVVGSLPRRIAEGEGLYGAIDASLLYARPLEKSVAEILCLRTIAT